jgi:hypothetical protein
VYRGCDAPVASLSAATAADTDAEPPPPQKNGAKSVDPFELRRLKMQRWVTKVDSIGARLGGENEFDGVTSCTSVESSGESKVRLLDNEKRATLDRHGICADELTSAVVRIVAVDEHGQSEGIPKGILRHIEIQRFKKCGLGRERFTSLGEPDQASVRWRIGNIVHAFIVASVLSGLDAVRIDDEVQKVRQDPRVAKKNTFTCVYLGLGGSAWMLWSRRK